MEYESDGDTNRNCCARYSHQRVGKGTGGLGNKRTSGDHPNYGIIKISQNTEKSPGDLLSLCNIMAKGFRFMPLSLVRLRTFRLSTWVS